MKQYIKNLLKLTSFEFNRLLKFLLSLVSITLLLNVIGYIWVPMQYINRANRLIAEEQATTQQIIDQFDYFSFYGITNTLWILAPILLGISGLLLYSLFIWYREWLGKNTFIYRLLMLPISRTTLFLSKFIVILTGIFTLIGTQFASLVAGHFIVRSLMPSEWLLNERLIDSLSMQHFFHYIFPLNDVFYWTLGTGVTCLLVLFTVILFERSFSAKGIVIGVLYGAGALSLALSPLFMEGFLNNYYLLYDSEIQILVIISLTLASLISITISRYLLKHKLTV